MRSLMWSISRGGSALNCPSLRKLLLLCSSFRPMLLTGLRIYASLFLAGPSTPTRLLSFNLRPATSPLSLQMDFLLWRLSATPFLYLHVFFRNF
jgi:hypothetical protein